MTFKGSCSHKPQLSLSVSVFTCCQDSLRVEYSIAITYCQQHYCGGEVWEILTLPVDCHVSEERTYNKLGLCNKQLGSEWQAVQKET